MKYRMKRGMNHSLYLSTTLRESNTGRAVPASWRCANTCTVRTVTYRYLGLLIVQTWWCSRLHVTFVKVNR